MNMPPACPHPAHIQPPIRHHPSSLPAIPDWADCRAAGSRARRFRQAISVGVAVALLVGRAVHAEPVGTGGVHVETDSFAATVTEDARRSGLPVSWIQAVMQAEGAGDARAVSPKGAMGLMKIMPETWASLRLCYGLGADPFDPHDNIVAGAAYLRELHDRYGSPDFLAAYNAGPARYEDHVATGRLLPAETRAYVAMLAPRIDSGAINSVIVVSATVPSWTDAPLFTVRSDGRSPTAQASSDAGADHRVADNGAKDLTALAARSDGLFVRTSFRNAMP
jgi:Transglycosylase SLT domain